MPIARLSDLSVSIKCKTIATAINQIQIETYSPCCAAAETPNAKPKRKKRTYRVKTVGDHQSNDESFEPETAERTGNGAMSLKNLTSSSALNTVITTILMCLVSKLIVS